MIDVLISGYFWRRTMQDAFQTFTWAHLASQKELKAFIVMTERDSYL